MRAQLSILAAAAVVLAALPAASQAATVSGVYSPESCDFNKSPCGPPQLTVNFTAEPGEANRLTVRLERGGTVGIEDPSAPLRAQGECTARSEHAAVCPPPANVVASLGDGDDVATVEPPSRLTGGEGADTLTAGSSSDVLSGGPGTDTLHGGASHDLLLDDDPLPVSDVYDGGDGDDVLSYAGRTAPVAVDLADPAPEGAPGEGDQILGVEGAAGGAGDDRLAGTDARNSLSGGGGRDTLTGRGGNDQLLAGGDDTAGDRVDAGPGDDYVIGSPGSDTLDLGSGTDFADPATGPDDIQAGAGDDQVVLYAGGQRRSRLRCGPGADELLYAPFDLAARLDDDCEILLPEGPEDRSGERLSLTPRAGSVHMPPARFTVGRFFPSEPGREYLRLELRLVEAGRPRSRERVIGAAQRTWRRGRRMSFAVPLRASGRRLLAARRRLDVRLVADRRRGGPRADRLGVRFTLRLRR